MGSGHKAGILAVGDRIFGDFKRIQLDRVDWLFVRIVVAAHAELAGRHWHPDNVGQATFIDAYTRSWVAVTFDNQLRSVAEFPVVRVSAASVAPLFTAMTFDEPILPHASTDFANRILL
jgi:hypothetical protein